MGRLARHYALETRAARDRLRMAHEPYWSSIHPGLFLGYRKGKRGGVWYTRRMEGTHYVKDRIGIADDHRDADNQTVFSFAQAQKKAIEWAGTASRGLSTAFDPNYTVADAVRDYLDWADLHQKAPKRTRQTVNAHILPRLGTIRASELSPHQIERWRQGLVTKPRRHEKTAPDLQDPEILRKRKSSSNRILTVLKAALTTVPKKMHAPHFRVHRDNVRRTVGIEVGAEQLTKRDGPEIQMVRIGKGEPTLPERKRHRAVQIADGKIETAVGIEILQANALRAFAPRY